MKPLVFTIEKIRHLVPTRTPRIDWPALHRRKPTLAADNVWPLGEGGSGVGLQLRREHVVVTLLINLKTNCLPSPLPLSIHASEKSAPNHSTLLVNYQIGGTWNMHWKMFNVLSFCLSGYSFKSKKYQVNGVYFTFGSTFSQLLIESLTLAWTVFRLKTTRADAEIVISSKEF